MSENNDIVSCRQCANLDSRRKYDERDPFEYTATMMVQICRARPSMANLKSFPFMVTTCGAFTAQEEEHDGRRC